MSAAAEIALTQVSRRYGARAVVNNATLVAPAGRVLALLGPSGSGKSTILRLIAGLEAPDAGEIRIGDETVSSPRKLTPPQARRLGFVFQDYALFPHLDALANVGFGLHALPAAERAPLAQRWLDRVGLGARAHAYPHQLSGGEQQRVALARALAPSPRAVLLDEPFSGLDPALRAQLRDVALAALSETGATIVFVTHHADEALLVADRLAVMKDGRILQADDPRAVYAAPSCIETAAALGEVNACPGIVRAGVADTPFGPVAAAGMAEGGAVTVVVRVEGLSLAPGARARVIGRRPQGANDLVSLRAGETTWRALIPASAPSSETADVAINPAAAFVFAQAPP
jgi:iron(III) transport system ATP-binding protein